VLITVSKAFRANIGGRLTRKLTLDLKATAQNYWWVKRLSKNTAGKGGKSYVNSPSSGASGTGNDSSTCPYLMGLLEIMDYSSSGVYKGVSSLRRWRNTEDNPCSCSWCSAPTMGWLESRGL